MVPLCWQQQERLYGPRRHSAHSAGHAKSRVGNKEVTVDLYADQIANAVHAPQQLQTCDESSAQGACLTGLRSARCVPCCTMSCCV